MMHACRLLRTSLYKRCHSAIQGAIYMDRSRSSWRPRSKSHASYEVSPGGARKLVLFQTVIEYGLRTRYYCCIFVASKHWLNSQIEERERVKLRSMWREFPKYVYGMIVMVRYFNLEPLHGGTTSVFSQLKWLLMSQHIHSVCNAIKRPYIFCLLCVIRTHGPVSPNLCHIQPRINPQGS